MESGIRIERIDDNWGMNTDEFEELFEKQRAHHIRVSKPYADIWGESWTVKALAEETWANDYAVFGAYDGTTICGFVVIYDDDDAGKHGYIPELFVSEDYRGRGIATMLMEAAHSYKPYETIHLEVMEGNESVIELYEKLGYRPAATMLYWKRESEPGEK